MISIASALSALGCGLLLQDAAGLDTSEPVLAVVFAMTLSRRPLDRAAFGVVPVLGAVGAGIGMLITSFPAVGDTVFALGLAVSIWLRRFGPGARRAGALVATAFVGILVSPVQIGGGAAGAGWAALTALIACACVAAVRAVADAVPGGKEPEAATDATAPTPLPRRDPDQDPATAPVPVTVPTPAPAGGRGNRGRRLRVSDRMAVQMGVSVGAAFAVAHQLWPLHWAWAVLTAFLVCSGNRGRGDVVHKSLHRLAGAGAGTVVATLASGVFAPGARAGVVAIFVVLGVGTWLRPYGYAYWACAMTAVLSLLQGYFGQTGSVGLLGERLAAIAVGAVLGTAVSYVVLPVRTRDVARRRAGDALRALGALLRAAQEERGARQAEFDAAVAQLEQIAAALRLHRALRGRLPGRPAPQVYPADLLDAVRACATAVAEGRDPRQDLGHARSLLRDLAPPRPAPLRT